MKIKLWLQFYAFISWSFFICWLCYGVFYNGWEWMMPKWYKGPLLLSLFGPVMAFLIDTFIQVRKQTK